MRFLFEHSFCYEFWSLIALRSTAACAAGRPTAAPCYLDFGTKFIFGHLVNHDSFLLLNHVVLVHMAYPGINLIYIESGKVLQR